MAITLPDVSEIICGQVLEGKLSINAVNPNLLFPPYDEIIRELKNGSRTIEELIEKVGLQAVNSSIDASRNLNGTGNADWLSILEKKASLYEAGRRLEKASRSLQKGEFVDIADIVDTIGRAETGNIEIRTANEIERTGVPFAQTGFEPFDHHLTGLPEVGLIVVGGNTGSGKTWLGANLAESFVRNTSGICAFFSLEMLAEEVILRITNKLTEEQKSRLNIIDNPVSPENVVTTSARIQNVKLIIVDFADLLVRGENSESSMAHIYRTLAFGAKKLRCCIVLLSQLSRSYDGGMPRPYNLRYTGLAEALSWGVIMTWNPAVDYYAERDTDKLPLVAGKAYTLIWKLRGGFKVHPDANPGAIQISFRQDKGWRMDKKGTWFNLRKYG